LCFFCSYFINIPFSALYDAFATNPANPFSSAYGEASRKEVTCTMHTDKCKTATDYMFFVARQVRVVPRSARYYASNVPLPNALWPSTHFPLVCDFFNLSGR
jgi:hypothetical protein